MDPFLSIISCCRNNNSMESLKKHIAHSLFEYRGGYEVLFFDNSKQEYDIFQQYNNAIPKSKGDVLVFIHDDIRFVSEYWGNVVSKWFNEEIGGGVLGVIGTQFLPSTPSAWWDGCASVGQILQGGKINNIYSASLFGSKATDEFEELVSIDGLFMCIRHSLFEKIRFDDVSFSGFHGYDTDICLQTISAGYKVQIARDILIEHRSVGNHDRMFYLSCERLFNKWGKLLPIVRGREMSAQEMDERSNIVYYLYTLRHDLYMVKHSKAYHIGTLILRPIKKIINK